MRRAFRYIVDTLGTAQQYQQKPSRVLISTEAEPRDNTNRSRAAQAAEPKGGRTKSSFGRLAPPRFCFGNSITFTQAEPRNNINRSRAAQAAESSVR